MKQRVFRGKRIRPSDKDLVVLLQSFKSTIK